MERERPEYLPAIRQSRWEFPWLLVIGIVLLGLMAGGVHMLTRTNAAWEQRFKPVERHPPTVDVHPERDAYIAEIRRRRAAAEQATRTGEAASRARTSSELRCIGGTLFRKIPGGWENLPGRSC